MSNQSNIKHVMRIALVGIKPADQVMLKGYLRVLLRLEADLEWVSANHSQVDLFMINEQFHHAANIVKLLQTQLEKPVLYISRDTDSNGRLTDNNLILPLKEMTLLNEWLFNHVVVLSRTQNISEQRKKSNSTLENKSNQSKEANLSNQQSQQTINTMNQNQEDPNLEDTKVDDAQYTNLISIIQRLKKGKHGVLEVIENDKIMAIVDPVRGLAWKNTASIMNQTPLHQWRVQAHVGETPPVEKSVNMKQWLWNVSWDKLQTVTVLTDNDTNYQIQFWPKPSENQERRDLLRVLTAIENKGGNLREIAETSETELDFTRKVVTGLLFSGYLKSVHYNTIEVNKADAPIISTAAKQAQPENIQQNQTQELQTLDSILSRRESGDAPLNHPSSTIGSEVINKTPSATITPEKKEKLGFLSRLRRRLGL